MLDIMFTQKGGLLFVVLTVSRVFDRLKRIYQSGVIIYQEKKYG